MLLLPFIILKETLKVEWFHRTLHNIMFKRLGGHLETWDLHLNQALLVAIRFNMKESTKFSPFYLLYNHDLVLPIAKTLKPTEST